MTYARRVDDNQEEIVAAMRNMGASVTTLHRVGNGVSDLLVSWRQKWFVMEVKNGDGQLNFEQKKWIGLQRAAVVIVTCPLDAVAFLQRVRP